MSLQARLLTSIVLVMTLSLAASAAFASWRAAARVRTELDAALRVSGQSVRTELDALTATADASRELPRVIATFDGDRHVQAEWRDGRDAVMDASRLASPSRPAPGWFSLLANSSPSVRVALPDTAGPGAVVLRADPSSELQESWDGLGDTFLSLASLWLPVALLVSWTVRRGLRPLAGLADGLARVEAGNLAARIGDPRPGDPPEIARLTAGFNRMAGRLAAVDARNRQLHEQMLTLQDEERADLARDLHDEIGPALFAIRLTANALLRLPEADREARLRAEVDAIQDAVGLAQLHVRDILARLRPLRAVELGLGPALDQMVAFWRLRDPGIAFTVGIGIEEAELDDAARETIYRVVQESVSNAVRHARPGRIDVAVTREDGDGVCVRVSDDGNGPAATADGGYGLAGMRERMAAVAGSLRIESSGPGRGWSVVAHMPAAQAGAAS